MSGAADLLSQDEIDALLHGVDSGEVETSSGQAPPGEVIPYDLASQERIVRGRMPTLEMVNERFARMYRVSLFNMLRRSPEISVQGVEVRKFSEYVHELRIPTNINLIRISPLRGTALLIIEAGLLFAVVEAFFGGSGRFPSKVEGREFTATEMRIVRLLLDHAFSAMVEAWEPVMRLQFEYLNSEVNPHFANIVSPSEPVVVSRFRIDIETGGGEIHVSIPYAMLEPIRELLDSGIAADRSSRDDGYSEALLAQIREAEMDVRAELAQLQLSRADLVCLKPGDVIPLRLPDQVQLLVEGVPAFRGRFGIFRGRNAVQIQGVVRADSGDGRERKRPVSLTLEKAGDGGAA